MGLDMFLYRAERNTVDRHDETAAAQDFCDCLKCRPKLTWLEEEEIGYWRKANQIHNWFITNLADGVDENQFIPVGVADLFALREACETELRNKPDVLPEEEDNFQVTMDDGNPQKLGQILADIFTTAMMEKELAGKPEVTDEHPLPPASGFMFGSTIRDEWYYKDLTDTLEIIKLALAQAAELEEDESIIYQSWW